MTTENEDRLENREDPQIEKDRQFKNKLQNLDHKTLVQNVIDLNRVIQNDMRMGFKQEREIEKLRGQYKKCCCPYCNHCRGWNQ